MTKPNGDELEVADLANSFCLPARTKLNCACRNESMHREVVDCFKRRSISLLGERTRTQQLQ